MRLWLAVMERLGFLFCLAALGSGVARAHPGEEESIRLVLLEWANGIARSNSEQVARSLTTDFEHQSHFSGVSNPERYLALIAAGEAPMQAIDLRHTRYAVTGDHAKASEILGVVMQTTAVAAEASLVRSSGRWRIQRIAEQAELPAFAQPDEPEHSVLETTLLRVVDQDGGHPIASRIHVEDDAGRYWAPEGHSREIATGWRESVGKDVRVAGQIWAYVPGETRLHLPAGRYSIELKRGFEYTPVERSFEVRPGEPTELRIELARWADVRKQGWY